ncbi:hypotheical protein [Mycobacterium phage PP]|uniref:Hypotheical protein n=1 Tax=Mycobacterium phage PP TaxID=2077134 RepID=A0A2Z5XVH0_9CAUD|nr:hypothetical protein KIW36_gp41 [Mycobacterium phage PP]BBC53850.1 hypotheical protein [Mycobacterium phage PP]
MTIYVRTHDYGLQEFPTANDWRTEFDGLDKGPRLWVGDDESDLAVAEFAPGTWAYVYEKTTVESEEPRQWDSLYYTDFNATVTDRDGDTYKHDGLNWCWYPRASPDKIENASLRDWDGNAPFTEVLDA